MLRIVYILSLCLLFLPAHAQADTHGDKKDKQSLITTKAKQAIVVDYNTGMVLFEKNADQRMPTSSMSKVMTAYMIFDALKKGDLKLNDEFNVSEKAWKKGGSKMFVEAGERVSVEDLLRGVIVQSGNDATIVLAESLGGSEDVFATKMTEKAHELGMSDSNFVNASGWPDPDHYSTARDLTTLSTALFKNFPEYYRYYGEKEFTYSNITQANRNPLLYRNIGADGIKTGHTEIGGYGLIGSGQYNGRRVILVLNGMESQKERAGESAKMLEWGLRRFENKTLFKAGEQVDSLNVTMGKDKNVPVQVKNDLAISIPKIALKDYKVNVIYNDPIIAPIKAGSQVATLKVDVPYVGTQSYPLYAAQDVKELGFISKTFVKMKRALTNIGK